MKTLRRTVVEDVHARVAEAVDQRVLREPRPTGEARRLVGVGQRRGRQAEGTSLAGGAEERAGDRRDDQRDGGRRHDCPPRQAREQPRAVRWPRGRARGRQLGRPFSQVGGQDESGRQSEQAGISDRLQREIGERDGERDPVRSGARGDGQPRGREPQHAGRRGQWRRTATRRAQPGRQPRLRPEEIRPQPDHPGGDREATDGRDQRRLTRAADDHPGGQQAHDGQAGRLHPPGVDQPARRALSGQAQRPEQHQSGGDREGGRGGGGGGMRPRSGRPPRRRHNPAQGQQPEQEALGLVVEVRRGDRRALPRDELAQIHQLNDVRLVEPAQGGDLREQLQRQQRPRQPYGLTRQAVRTAAATATSRAPSPRAIGRRSRRAIRLTR